MKPIIQLSVSASPYGKDYPKKWVCHDNFFIMGFGDTYQEAYDCWRSKESNRTKIPRRGCWNLKDCRDWYKRGCPAIRSYIGSKLIVAYDATLDELILRG